MQVDAQKILNGQGKQILSAYAWILFLNRPVIGAIFLLLTFWLPNIGSAGLLAAITASVITHSLKFAYRETGIHIFNAILVGLSIGAFYQIDPSLILLIIVSASLTVFVTVMLMNILLNFGTLPVLSAPFVLVAITTAFAAKSFANLTDFASQAPAFTTWLPETFNQFFIALGSIFFLPYPVVGAIIFACIVWQSRYLAFLSLTGFIASFSLYEHFTATQLSSLAIYNGFNFSLTAMALGAIYVVPGIRSFIIAMLGSVAAAVITSAVQNFMILYNLPVMATPFILTTLTILSALKARQTMTPPWLRLESPNLPEVHYERARIATYRIGDFNSVPLNAPFYGTWHVYQGFNGKYTHQPPWQHALDFISLENGISFRNKGETVDDYYCYGLPVKSPTYGTIARAFDLLADNIPGEVDIKNNWGNFILIRLDSGLFVLLAHLKQHSIKIKENEKVTPGQILAACGNSGRSPQPHLHLQVQRMPVLGSETYPFHLTSVNLQAKNESAEFKLVAHPKEEDAITPLESDAVIANALHLPVGRSLCYEFQDGNQSPVQRKLSVTLSLLGEFRLNCDSGQNVAFLENNGLLAFYDYQGKHDQFMAMWLLALGLTPYSAEVTRWLDSPSADLLPKTLKQKIIYLTRYPLGTGIQSQYTRQYDQENNLWIQQSKHQLKLGFEELSATAEAILSRRGCERITLQIGQNIWQGKLIDIDQQEDIGIHFNKQ